MLSLSSLVAYLEVPHPSNEPRPTFLVSHDTKPIEKARRVWAWTGFFGVWCTAAFSMSNFQLGSSLLALGLNWWQTIVATFFGHLFSALIVLGMGIPGLEYRISFPISTRVGWGYVGSIFVVLNRIVTAVIFTAVQGWMGGLVTYVCLRALWPSIDRIPNTLAASTGTTSAQFVGFVVWYVVQIATLFLTPENVRFVVMAGGALGFVVQLVLTCWACGTMGDAGFGSVLASQNGSLSPAMRGWMMVYGMSLTSASITTASLSVCDYTRFARRFASGTWSQLAGALPAWLANVFGVLTIAATQNRYGRPLWNLPTLLIAVQDADPTSGTRVAVFFAAFCMALLQLALNIAGNTFSGGTDMAALLPRWINIRRGQVATALLAVCINPWYLVSSATVFLSAMSSYAVILQPFMGIMVAEYFVVQKRRLRVADLYMLGSESIYWYTLGVNWRAVLAWLVGTIPHFPGFINTVNATIPVSMGSKYLYYLDAYSGFLLAFVVIVLLDLVAPVKRQKEYIASVSRVEAIDINEKMIVGAEIVNGVQVVEQASSGGLMDRAPSFDEKHHNV